MKVPRAALFPGLGSGLYKSEENELRLDTCIFFPSFHYGCDVTSNLKFLPLWFSRHDGA